MNWLLGPYPGDPWPGGGAGPSGGSSDANGAALAMFYGTDQAPASVYRIKPSSPLGAGGNPGVIPERPNPTPQPPAPQDVGGGGLDDSGGVNPEDVNPGSRYSGGKLPGSETPSNPADAPLPPTTSPQSPSSPDDDGEADGGRIIGADDDPGGGTSWDEDGGGGAVGYLSNAAYQVIAGDYTPDANRNALGTAGEIGVGLLPIAGTIASGRDLSQNLSNWQWSWGHGLKTLGNVVGLVPFARGVISGGKALTRGLGALGKVEGTIAKAAGNLGDAIGAEQKLATASKKLAIIKEGCFGAGTPILTPDGSKLIEQFQRGNWVLAAPDDDLMSPPVPRRVEAVFESFLPTLDLHVNGRTIRTTAEHPFWVKDRGWVDAQQLETGHQLRTHDGRWLEVEGVEGPKEAEPVYNLSVSDYHTYFVGHQIWGFSVWSHNDGICGPLAPNSPRTFSSSDPLVADLANKIEAANPGHVVGVNVPIRNAAGELVTDADILLQNAAIQVKSGGGKGLAAQLVRTEEATGLPTIGYGPTLKPSVVKNIQNSGGLVTKDEALLLEVVKP